MHRFRAKPIGLPAPRFGVHLAAWLLLRTDPKLTLYGRDVIPKHLTDEGFTFEYPNIRDALAEIYR